MVWVTRGSRVTYENAWIRVREDDVLRPDGEPGIYGVMELRAPAVFVVPVTEAGEVVMVTLDRYATGRSSIEIPAGGSESDDLLEAARRELREETGFAADHWQDLGEVFSLNGVADAPGRVFLATGLHPVDGAEQEAEGITACRSVPFEELSTMIADGTITDGETLAALLKALVAIGTRPDLVS
ncbi:MAG TPA: NUDIX hydrolase [Propionibacteriaceae bacterium]